MNNTILNVVLPSFGIAFGFAITLFGYLHNDEIGWLMGSGAGLILFSLPLLMGIAGTAPGALLCVAGAALGIVSSIAGERSRKQRRRQARTGETR